MKNPVKIIILIFVSLFSLSACLSTGSYEGAYRNGKYHGNGTLTFDDGEKYVGSFYNGKRNGYGTNFFPSGEKYIGYWKNGKRNGKGTNYWPNGNKYEGNFKNDKKDGKGIFTFKSGNVQEGMWRNDLYQYYVKVKDDLHQEKQKFQRFTNLSNSKLCSKAIRNDNGTKKWLFEHSSLFVKEAKRRGLDCGIQDRIVSSSGNNISNKNIKNKTNSLKDNYSRNNKKNNLSNLPNCSLKSINKHLCFGKRITKRYEYVGEFKNNMMHGKGKYTHKANDNNKGYVHIGGYINNKRHGYGEATWRNGQTYVGQYVNGDPTYGTLRYSNGNRYEGEFKNHLRDGEGTYFFKKGTKKEGIWSKDKFKYAKKITKTKKTIANKTEEKSYYDDLYLSRQEIERERNKRIELEHKLASLLAKQKEERDIIDADIRVPILEIISNKTKGKRGTIRGLAKDNVQVVEVTVDGKEVNISSNGNFEYSTYVPPSGVKLKIEVTDAAGLTTSKIVELKGNLEFGSPTISFDRLNPLSKRVKSNPNAFALIVGVSKYENTNAKAMYADNDALVFKDYAVEKLGIKPGKIKVLLNNKADEKEILLSIKEWLRRSAKPNKSDIFVFFAGHGLASDDGKDMYLLPYDGSPRLLEKTAILRDELFSDLKAANPKSVTVFLDTCYSGVTRNEEMLIAGRPIVIKAKEQAIPDGFTLFSAASNEQISRPLEEAKHGMFSYFLMKGMEGDADANNDKKITARELHEYVEQNVVQQSSGSQTPELQGDKDIVLVQFN